MRYFLQQSPHTRGVSTPIRNPASSLDQQHPLLRLQRSAGNQAIERALEATGTGGAEAEANRLATATADAIAPASDFGAAGDAVTPDGRLAPALREQLNAALGWDVGGVRIHADALGEQEARAHGAVALTRGSDLYFRPETFQPQTRSGLRLLSHELAHAHQQAAGQAPKGALQKKEDWDFTPADYGSLVKGGKDLRFGPDSAWLPKALQDNLLSTLKFALTSTKPVRTAGINVKDFYHGHFVVPTTAVSADLTTARSDFETKSEALQGKALGGHWFDPVTSANLPAYTKAIQDTEKLATPLLEKALTLKGAAVFYHTFELSGPAMKPGSPTRNIRTPIGGTPSGFDPSGTEANANQFRDDNTEILQFAFLVDETGVIHVTVGTTSNLSRVTGTPMN
jgi:hypothetical protein